MFLGLGLFKKFTRVQLYNVVLLLNFFDFFQSRFLASGVNCQVQGLQAFFLLQIKLAFIGFFIFNHFYRFCALGSKQVDKRKLIAIFSW
jgi:hypothetical protein